MNYKELLLQKVNNKTFKVGIVGLGYVGLPLGLEFAEKEFNVLGFDMDQRKIDSLEKGETYIKHIPTSRISKSVNSGFLKSTTDFSRMPEVDALIICVPTPLDEHREPDMSYVEGTAKTIQKYLRKGQLVTLESTTYPGTTEEMLLPLFENAPIFQSKMKAEISQSSEKIDSFEMTNVKFVVGEDFFLAYSPEREDPNNPDYNTSTIPKVVGGMTENCSEVAKAIYEKVIVSIVPVSSPAVAEATKIVENVYRSINIALVNELKMVFDKMGIDVWEVINAAKTKPFGFNAFYPGPGLGGHCIPIDPFYLTWKAREFEVNTKFIELAGEINTYQPYYVVEKAMAALNETKKSLNGSKVLLMGAAYKKNVDDMRESPSLKLIEILREKGAEVDYNDPYIPVLPKTRKYNYKMESVELTAENIAKYDLILLSTDHDDYKEHLNLIHKNAKAILDTRNMFQGYKVFKG
ncbi:MAG: nucleotide sugar dehydrogenase [Bacteroidetes bacterium]|nr:nucleotide sugar dehydrogenase [Bacteroidota bacterium]MBU1115697.1 nucleotide sugar dehydrogenase [Bacteroidota bacterium]MBU1799946.1 nucleotide sugar dehydrogenase [Bacteroidota bacterium]